MKKLSSFRSIFLLLLLLTATISVTGQNRPVDGRAELSDVYPSARWIEFGESYVERVLNNDALGKVMTLTVETRNLPGALSYSWHILSGSNGNNIAVLSGGKENTPYITFKILNISLVGIEVTVRGSAGSAYASFLGSDYLVSH